MSKRLGAALGALLAFATVLAVVPLVSAEPADAHTKTKRSCYYHPIQGLNCWNAPVKHSHDPPPDIAPYLPRDTTTTTAAPPPTTTTTEPPKCPAGQRGTPPNCEPDVCPAGQRGTPPNCEPDVCPAGQRGTPPNCEPDVCPTGQTGTPPNCEPDVCPTGQTGTPPNCKDACPSGTFVSGTCQPRGTGTTTPVTKCTAADLQTGLAHDHGEKVNCHSKFHPADGHTHTRAEMGLSEHDAIEAAIRRAASLVATGTTESLSAARDLLVWIGNDVKEDALWAADQIRRLNQEIDKLYNKLPSPVRTFIESVAAGVGCIGLAALVAKTVIATAGTATPKWVVWLGSTQGKAAVGVTCTAAYDAAKDAITGDDDSSDDDSSDDDSSDDDSSDDDSSDDDSSDDDDSDDDSSANSETKPPTTAPAFNPHTQCHAWHPVLRMCYRLVNGVPRITYH